MNMVKKNTTTKSTNKKGKKKNRKILKRYKIYRYIHCKRYIYFEVQEYISSKKTKQKKENVLKISGEGTPVMYTSA